MNKHKYGKGLKKRMNNTQELLLLRVSQALFGIPDSTTLPKDVLEEAKVQTVSSLITNDYQALAKNIRCIAAHAELTKILKDLPFTTFKGYASAFYYPIPEKRMMGDVDFIVAPDHYQEAVDRLLQYGWTRVKHDADHHETFSKSNVTFELHWEINGVPNGVEGIKTEYVLAEKKVRELLANLINTSITVETQQGSIVIPDEFHHGLIMLLHVAGHMMNSGGIGLRHICDWAVFVNRIDLEKYRDILEESGLWTFACQLTAFSSAYLGLPEKSWAGEWPKIFLEDLKDDIFLAGNFSRKNPGRGSTLTVKATSFADLVKKKVPFARNHSILLPFAILYYLLHYVEHIFQGRAKLINLSTLRDINRRQRLYNQFRLFNNEGQGEDMRQS